MSGLMIILSRSITRDSTLQRSIGKPAQYQVSQGNLAERPVVLIQFSLQAFESRVSHKQLESTTTTSKIYYSRETLKCIPTR